MIHMCNPKNQHFTCSCVKEINKLQKKNNLCTKGKTWQMSLLRSPKVVCKKS